MDSHSHSGKIAIIGGGPAGLVALKSVREDGLEAILFEQSDEIGGQWNQGTGHSGIWDNLHTNSSKYLTAFSDLSYPDDASIYPSHQQVRQYLETYKRRFDLDPFIRLNSRVLNVQEASDNRYEVTWESSGQSQQSAIFQRVIIASGRFNRPYVPKMEGLEDFKGTVMHAFHYRSSDKYKGRRVLVIGSRVTAMEVASDLSLDDSITVVSSCRQPKYIVKKMINGQPNDHLLFTRFRNFTAAAFPPEVNAAKFKEYVLNNFGNPADYGGLRPSENIAEAGIAVCETFLEQIQKGRIIPKSYIQQFAKDEVVFKDGTTLQIDDVIFATGYELSLPFLDQRILSIIHKDGQHLDLYKYTFHPGLPNLAFIGLYLQIGGFFPTLELQARWITGCWSGHIVWPDPIEMLAWIKDFQQRKDRQPMAMSHQTSLLFASAAGVEPELDRYPELAGPLLFGPLVPSQFRLQGHGKKDNARQLYLQNVIGGGGQVGPPTGPQIDQLKEVAKELKDNKALQSLILHNFPRQL